MDSRVRAAVAAGQGLVTSARLHALGITSSQLARWVRAGELVAVRRGVYTTAELWSSWDEYAARPLARIRASHLTLEVPHVYSHDSSALIQQVRLIRPQDSEVHVTRRGVNGSRVRHGVRHHGAAYGPEQVHSVDGLPVLDVPRTVVDLARTHGYRAGLVAADGALQAGITRAAMAEAAASMVSWPGITQVRAAIEDAVLGAESVGETLARELVCELGHGVPETQFPVRIPSGIAWCDLRLGCHVFEFHGRIKLRSVERGGVAEQAAEQVAWDERRRERDVCAEGLGASRIYWDDLWGAARDRALERLERERTVTERRFGNQLPVHLAEFAARVRGQRVRRAG
jgi:predicted transcriptional regulator of viral defense system